MDTGRSGGSGRSVYGREELNGQGFKRISGLAATNVGLKRVGHIWMCAARFLSEERNPKNPPSKTEGGAPSSSYTGNLAAGGFVILV